MENIVFTYKENTFHVQGFPNAVKVLKISGPKSRRLSHLALHKDDFDFTIECLELINHIAVDRHLLRDVLWEMAIVRYIKCFGQSASRFSLDPKKIYQGDASALAAYNFFADLRHKHIIHDENSYLQCLPGAILNKEGMDCKIAKIICLSVAGASLGQENYQNLHLLATTARTWVVEQFDKICNALTCELEAKSYDELLEMEGINYTVPTADDVHSTRTA